MFFSACSPIMIPLINLSNNVLEQWRNAHWVGLVQKLRSPDS